MNKFIQIKLETFQGETFVEVTEETKGTKQTDSRKFDTTNTEVGELLEMVKNLVRRGK